MAEIAAPVRQSPAKLDGALALAVCAMGATTVITQVVVMREFLSVFYGNELVIGVVLTNWMVLTGLGAFLGKASGRLGERKDGLMALCLVLTAVLPITTVFFLDYLRNIVFLRGSMVGIIQVLWGSFVLLAPFCLVSGFSFTLFSHAISERRGANLITWVYALEAAGGVVGGLVFNLVLIYFLRTFQTLLLVMAFDLAARSLLARRLWGRAARYTAAALSAALVLALLPLDLDAVTRGFLFPDQEVVYHRDTPYGSLTVTGQAEQKNFFENGVLMFSTYNVEANEESVHYAMLQHPAPKTVLLISGGISGMAEEVFKYGSVERVAYVELNPWVIDVGRRYTDALSDPRVRVIKGDPRLYLKGAGERYDVVLINVPDPGTAQINRLFTVEFFADLKRRLNEGAVVSAGLLSAADYWGEDALMVSSVIHNTMKGSFKNVLIVPGWKNFFIASDRALRIDIAGMVEERGLDTLYVNQYYIEDASLKERSDNIMDNLDTGAALNRDFLPVAYYVQLRYWLSQYRLNYWAVALPGLAILALAAFRMNTVSFGLFTGGFAAASMELVLIIAFQVIYGYVFHMTGLIVAAFMGGLAAGSLYAPRLRPFRADMAGYALSQFAVGLYCVALPFVLLLLKSAAAHHYLVHAAFFLVTFAMAALVGVEFSIAARLRRGGYASVASELYGVDLLGSALGALWVTTYLLPLLGIINVCFVVASLSFVSGANSWLRRKRLEAAAV